MQINTRYLTREPIIEKLQMNQFSHLIRSRIAFIAE